MKIKFVYYIFPALVVYTDRIKEGLAGCANAMVVRIRPSHKNDEGILRHELTHVRQSYRGFLLIHALLYLCIRAYRLKAEVEAYRAQLEHVADDCKIATTRIYAGFLTAKYNLGIDVAEAGRLLKAGG